MLWPESYRKLTYIFSSSNDWVCANPMFAVALWNITIIKKGNQYGLDMLRITCLMNFIHLLIKFTQSLHVVLTLYSLLKYDIKMQTFYHEKVQTSLRWFRDLLLCAISGAKYDITLIVFPLPQSPPNRSIWLPCSYCQEYRCPGPVVSTAADA